MWTWSRSVRFIFPKRNVITIENYVRQAVLHYLRLIAHAFTIEIHRLFE